MRGSLLTFPSEGLIVSFMTKETKELRQQIVEDIDETGLRIKSLILELLRKEVPVLPRYDQWSQGFQEDYESYYQKSPEIAQQERRSGIKLYTDWASSGVMIVLEQNGIFEIPIKTDEHFSLYPSFDDMREIQPADYLIYARQALEEIGEWAEGKHQPQEISPLST